MFTLPCVWAICPHKTTLGHRIGNKVSVANTPLIRAPAKVNNRTNVVIQFDTLSSQACCRGGWELAATYHTEPLVDRWR